MYWNKIHANVHWESRRVSLFQNCFVFAKCENVALFESGVQQKWNTLPPRGLFITPAEPLLMAAGATASRCIAVIKDICSALFSGFSMARPMELRLGLVRNVSRSRQCRCSQMPAQICCLCVWSVLANQDNWEPSYDTIEVVVESCDCDTLLVVCFGYLWLCVVYMIWFLFFFKFPSLYSLVFCCHCSGQCRRSS